MPSCQSLDAWEAASLMQQQHKPRMGGITAVSIMPWESEQVPIKSLFLQQQDASFASGNTMITITLTSLPDTQLLFPPVVLCDREGKSSKFTGLIPISDCLAFSVTVEERVEIACNEHVPQEETVIKPSTIAWHLSESCLLRCHQHEDILMTPPFHSLVILVLSIVFLSLDPCLQRSCWSKIGLMISSGKESTSFVILGSSLAA